jgi:hypothetical protein
VNGVESLLLGSLNVFPIVINKEGAVWGGMHFTQCLIKNARVLLAFSQVIAVKYVVKPFKEMVPFV